MATRIVVPDAGQNTDELLLASWHVSVGDPVAVGDILADIETDKAVAELEAYVAGHVLALLAEAGDTIRTGQTLLWIGAIGEEMPDKSEPVAEPGAEACADHPATCPTELSGKSPLATPAARTVARQRGVDLSAVTGTGPEGCIVKRDVPLEPQQSPPAADGLRGTSEPLSSLRRAMAARLQESVREAPQFHLMMEVDMTHALAARRIGEHKATITDVIVKVTADTLAEFPRLNCRLEGDTIHHPAQINIGIAVSLEDGLVVPVLTGADRLSLVEVARESRRLIANARAGRLAAEPRSTFTVSNLGMFGVKAFIAIINPPEAAILAVGAIKDKLVLTGAGVSAVPTLTLTLSSDHRLVDGALAARFLKALRERLEAPAATQA